MKTMEKFLRENILFIVVAVIAVAVVLFNTFSSINEYRKMEKSTEEEIKLCENMPAAVPTDRYEYCMEILKTKDDKIDMYTVLFDTVSLKSAYLNPLSFLLLIIPTTYLLSNNYDNLKKSKKKNIKSNLKNYFKSAYRYCLFLPFLFFIMFGLCWLLFSHNPEYAANLSNIPWQEFLVKNEILCMVLYFINIFLNSLSYINISLISTRISQNIFISCVISVLIYAVMQFGIYLIFKFNLVDIFAFNYTTNPIFVTVLSLVILLMTVVIVYILYKNSDELIVKKAK